MALGRTVAVILTVKNDAAGCLETLRSLALQSRRPEETIIVDGGSTDGTLAALRCFAEENPGIRIIEAPGANIARGRNVATQAASTEIIAATDGGCQAEVDWLEKLIRPFEIDPQMEFVGGFYRVAPQSLLETVVGLSTMRGQGEPETDAQGQPLTGATSADAVKPETFNPSGRSMAYTKDCWRRMGGWPEWLLFSEDTLFSTKLRQCNVRRCFAGDAVVHWRPRTSLRSIARQFFNYGTGRGHTQIGAADFRYHLRNLLGMLTALAFGIWTPWAIALLGILVAYFHVWAFHDKAAALRRYTNRIEAYPLTLLVVWTVLYSNLAGYLVGTWQRQRDQERYARRLENYMAQAT